MPRPPCLCTGRPEVRCDDAACDIASPEGAPGDVSRCVVCWQWLHSAEHRRAWGGGELPGAPGGAARPPYRLRLTTPCVHLGPRTGERRDCLNCGGAKDVPIHSCPKHGTCTPRDRLRYRDAAGAHVEVPWCVTCDDYQAPKPHLEWLSTAKLAADAALLASQLPPDAAGVAGIPRSGMIPATVIAAHLHLPLWQLTEEGRLEQLGHGSRGRNLGFAGDAGGPLVVIDDTVYSGAAMRRARLHLRGTKALFGAVYARPEAAGVLDFHGRALPCPHLLEWNILHNGPARGHCTADAVRHWRAGVGVDLDGILLHDAASGGRLGAPYLPARSVPLKLIATGRPERTRAETQVQLARWGIRWDRLEMLPDGQAETPEAIAAHKARHYGESDLGFFLESDPGQAEEIARLAGKPVICPLAGRVFVGSDRHAGGPPASA